MGRMEEQKALFEWDFRMLVIEETEVQGLLVAHDTNSCCLGISHNRKTNDILW